MIDAGGVLFRAISLNFCCCSCGLEASDDPPPAVHRVHFAGLITFASLLIFLHFHVYRFFTQRGLTRGQDSGLRSESQGTYCRSSIKPQKFPAPPRKCGRKVNAVRLTSSLPRAGSLRIRIRRRLPGLTLCLLCLFKSPAGYLHAIS